MVFFVHFVLKIQFNDISNEKKNIQNGIVQMHFSLIVVYGMEE